MLLAEAQALAERVVDMLKPACLKIEIAGSVRRRKPVVGDIEIVALPIVEVQPDMFGASDTVASKLEYLIGELLENGNLVLDKVIRRNGEKYKRFREAGIAIDLFIADPGNYGNILAIRTGDSSFSKALVTGRRDGGLMPTNLKQRDGYLWRGNERIDCSDEVTYFIRMDMGWIDPPMRTWPLCKVVYL